MAKKKATRAGRPPLPEEERMGAPAKFRLKDEDRSLIEEAASAAEVSFSAFVREAAIKEARRVLAERAS